MSGELLTVKETADRLGIRIEVLYGWIKRRGLPCYSISRRSRYCDWTEVQDWLRSHRASVDDGAAVLPRQGVVIELPRRNG